jgi:hypothetical protein
MLITDAIYRQDPSTWDRIFKKYPLKKSDTEIKEFLRTYNIPRYLHNDIILWAKWVYFHKKRDIDLVHEQNSQKFIEELNDLGRFLCDYNSKEIKTLDTITIKSTNIDGTSRTVKLTRPNIIIPIIKKSIEHYNINNNTIKPAKVNMKGRGRKRRNESNYKHIADLYTELKSKNIHTTDQEIHDFISYFLCEIGLEKENKNPTKQIVNFIKESN